MNIYTIHYKGNKEVSIPPGEYVASKTKDGNYVIFYNTGWYLVDKNDCKLIEDK